MDALSVSSITGLFVLPMSEDSIFELPGFRS